MRKVTISEFRANLLKYLVSLKTGESICITSNGKPLATVTPPFDQKARAREELRSLAKTAELKDVITPTGEKWEAMS